MISLGQKNNCYPCVTCESSAEEKMHYPTLYFTVDQKIKCPQEGTATIKFRKVESAENERDPEDPKYRYELEVQGIDMQGEVAHEEKPEVTLKVNLRKALNKE